MNPAITHLLIEKWVCHLIIPTLCFQLLRTHWVTVQAKNSVKMPLLALHLHKSRTKAITRVPLIVTYTEGKKEYSTKENKSKLW